MCEGVFVMNIAIITGASSGMGREFARQLDSEGLDQLWLIARRRDRLEELAAGLRTPCRTLPLDLTDPAAADRLVQALTAADAVVRVLICAAGFGKYGTWQDLTRREIHDMIAVNDRALVDVTYAVLPHMDRGGRILTMGSASAFQPLPEFNLYASTKAFAVHFSRALNVELKARGITVTCVCPGFVRTEFFQVAQDTANPDTCQNFTPLYEPEDVVRKALKDSRRGRDLSVLGLNTKAKRLSARLLPAGLVMKVWMKIK